MTTETPPAGTGPEAEAEDEAGGGVATLINAGLFVFMVVFAVGCGLLGWFG